MNRITLKQKFQGCILGKCVGDALGFIVEGQNQDYCTKFVESYIKRLQIPEENRGSFSFGQYSDDSQLARELMISLKENDGFYPESYARRIANIFKTDKIVGGGNATTNSANRLIKGFSWNQAGEPGPYAGNGSAMRVAPIRLFYFKKQDWHNNMPLNKE